MFGTIVPPFMIVRNQSISIVSLLSELSPVETTQSNGRPLNGPVPSWLTRFTSWDAAWVPRASCGRNAELSVSTMSSKRMGDCASTMCRSVNCTIEASAVRAVSRPVFAVARSSQQQREPGSRRQPRVAGRGGRGRRVLEGGPGRVEGPGSRGAEGSIQRRGARRLSECEESDAPGPREQEGTASELWHGALFRRRRTLVEPDETHPR
ncbi:MAG: hypothetical protein WDM88_06240 [Galbitalea sp.]